MGMTWSETPDRFSHDEAHLSIQTVCSSKILWSYKCKYREPPHIDFVWETEIAEQPFKQR